ncbi:MAG: 4-(cytidine 5'-diphospho)-2-C-methyl-D-erythritol kinase, partial [Pseudorhodobacter sp.]|nr:4-(cytidine 5'-diphospho)-2-C-methyl-D-erythritol kinase [Pseudorhodobacter sp.]
MTTERRARAKINLALHVTGRRPDGYHLLQSLVAFADPHDVVTVDPAPTLRLTLTGPHAAGLSDTDNLVLKAARLLHPTHGAHITLTKNLPVASGIGGGSADAAATLLALADLWSLPLPPPDRVLTLGADVPVCLHGQAATMQGIGEHITPATLPPLWAVLANPGMPVATAQVFSALEHRENAALPPIAEPFLPWLQAQRNDLQAAASRLAPVIATTLQALTRLPGCQLARMSGSGATCFALFAGPDQSQTAAEIL